MKTISQFLDHSQRAIYSVSPDDTIRQALEVMAIHNIGALLVLKEQKLVGIFSERDCPTSACAFNLVHTVNSIAMPLIGGMTHWSGPLIGAVLLGGVQQYFGSKNMVTPELSLLFVGVLMMVFVAIAPNGNLGLWQRLRGKDVK